MIKPDAWKFEQYIHSKTNSTTRLIPMKPARFAEEELSDKQDLEKVPNSEEPLFSAETIENAAESYCDYLDHISKDELTDEEKQQRQTVKNEIRRFAEKISYEVSFGETE